jgi:hypothetical protein
MFKSKNNENLKNIKKRFCDLKIRFNNNYEFLNIMEYNFEENYILFLKKKLNFYNENFFNLEKIKEIRKSIIENNINEDIIPVEFLLYQGFNLNDIKKFIYIFNNFTNKNKKKIRTKLEKIYQNDYDLLKPFFNLNKPNLKNNELFSNKIIIFPYNGLENYIIGIIEKKYKTKTKSFFLNGINYFYGKSQTLILKENGYNFPLICINDNFYIPSLYGINFYTCLNKEYIFKNNINIFEKDFIFLNHDQKIELKENKLFILKKNDVKSFLSNEILCNERTSINNLRITLKKFNDIIQNVIEQKIIKKKKFFFI